MIAVRVVAPGRSDRGADRSMAASRTILLGLAIWSTTLVLLRVLGDQHGGEVADISRYLAAEAFVIAGLLRLVCWRHDRQRASLRSGVALAAVGVVVPLLAVLAPWTTDGVTPSPPAALARAGAFGLIFAVMCLDVAPGARTASLRALTGLVAGFALCLAVAILVGPVTGGLLGEALLVLAWAALALARRRGPFGSTPAAALSTSLAMLIMALGECVRLGSLLVPGFLLDVAPGFDVAAAALAGTAAVVDYRVLARRAEADGTAHEVTTLRAALHDNLLAEQDRLHDARSMIFGMLGALELISTRPADRRDLERLVAAELSRLHSILNSDTIGPGEGYDLRATLAPVIDAHRLHCPTLRTDIDAVFVWGQPHATATAVDNVLHNARRHAPGALITITTQYHPDAVEIVVDDGGPGIPVVERERVLERAVRGAQTGAPGRGLGLHNARAAIAAQGGRLTLGDSPLGGLRVTMSVCSTPDVATVATVAPAAVG